MSSPVYRIKIERNVFVKMRDGVRLAVDIYRPDAPGRFPALLSITPYGKEVQSSLIAPIPPPQPPTSPCDEASIEAGDPEFFVPRGYVHVIADMRGTGYSEGELEGMFPETDGKDGYDLVEWIAQQPWCDGNVGMVGICYFATEQLLTAIEQPPHLRAICPWEPFASDLYTRGAYPGGVLSLFLYGLYYGTQPPRCGFAAKNVVSATMKRTPKEQLEKLFEEALSNPDLRQYTYLYHLLKYPYRNPIMIDFLLNPNDGPFYWERSVYTKADRIKVPTYLGGPWYPVLGFFASSAIDLYNRIKAPKKLWLWDAMDYRPWKARHEEMLRWFDYWLKGIDTGIMKEPPVKFSIYGTGQWREGDTWPPKEVTWIKLHLSSFNRLLEPQKFYQDALEYEEPDYFINKPWYISPKREYVYYSTPPLVENLIIAGRPVLHLYAEIDRNDTTFKVDLIDEAQGSTFNVTSAWLRASYREIDQERSTEWEIRHKFTEKKPVKPGEIYEYVIQMGPTAYLFRAGHRIRVEISSTFDPTDEAATVRGRLLFLCNAQTTIHKIYHDKKHPSYLTLPILK
jgi:predicted acyl esterase